MRDLVGKVAFITGGASGIGLGMADAFVKAGMKVVISDFRMDHLDESAEYFRQKGQEKNIYQLKLDVTDREAFAFAAEETERVFGKVHILCNNAGVGVLGPVKLAKFGDWDWVLGVMIGGLSMEYRFSCRAFSSTVKEGISLRLHPWAEFCLSPRARFIQQQKRQ